MNNDTIIGEAQATVRATPSDVFDFVLDLNRYRQADHKIGRVREIRRNGNTGTVRFSGRLRGLPGPTGVYPFSLTESRLVFGSPVGGSARWFLDSFEGSFDCAVTDAGTVVTHREAYRFKRPWRGPANWLLRRWLENDTAGEMERLKTLVEAASSSAQQRTARAPPTSSRTDRRSSVTRPPTRTRCEERCPGAPATHCSPCTSPCRSPCSVTSSPSLR